jgi:hypothetical protein
LAGARAKDAILNIRTQTLEVSVRLLRVFSMTALAAFLLTSCGDDATGPGNGNGDTGEWQGVIAQGDRVAITGLSGPILASFTAGNETVVRWTKSGTQSQFSLVSIDVDQDADGVAIIANYPSGEINVDVTFEVEVPTGVDLFGTVVSGNVEADDLESDVFAITVSGNVTVSTTEVAEATTVSGNVTATIGRADWGRDLEFGAVSGSVDVEIPSNTNAEVVATTTSGVIVSDFPLTGTPNLQQGTLGSGGPTLTLGAVSGNIRLRSGPAS